MNENGIIPSGSLPIRSSARFDLGIGIDDAIEIAEKIEV
jgi:hypothetical protein